MLKSFKNKLGRILNSELVADNERLLDVNDDIIYGLRALTEENQELGRRIEILTEERDRLKEEVDLLKKKLAPKLATERRFNQIDYWD
jgi:uncharacterized small protein (DUF1192 family)